MFGSRSALSGSTLKPFACFPSSLSRGAEKYEDLCGSFSKRGGPRDPKGCRGIFKGLYRASLLDYIGVMLRNTHVYVTKKYSKSGESKFRWPSKLEVQKENGMT